VAPIPPYKEPTRRLGVVVVVVVVVVVLVATVSFASYPGFLFVPLAKKK
jgi:hypothetical protein